MDFDGRRRFEVLHLRLQGKELQVKVWSLCLIPKHHDD